MSLTLPKIDNSYARLPERFYERQSPKPFPNPRLIALNDNLAADLGFKAAELREEKGLMLLSGNKIPSQFAPLAQAYAGHQFGGFSPQLGDGRAILLGEISTNGKHLDMQLKGSGRTPFSRRGDGLSALGPVLREYVVSEAMHQLSVPTTRALAAVASSRTVLRQEGELPSGVMTRIASSHLRVGTFQYFAARKDISALKTLTEFALSRHYSDPKKTENPALELLQGVITRQANLVAHWMSLGFIHGVMNTDNCSISGETIDYGPCAFMERFHPHCVFSAIDQNGRYAWSQQGSIAHWNLTRLAEALLPIISEDEDEAVSLAKNALAEFAKLFEDSFQKRFEAKLGLHPSAEDRENTSDFITETLSFLAEQEVDFTLFFRNLTILARSKNEENTTKFTNLFLEAESGLKWLSSWERQLENNPARSALVAEMAAANPIRIPRNHRVEEMIQAAYAGDFAPLKKLQAALSHPYEENDKFSQYERRPLPNEEVHTTFCGT